MLEVTLSTPTVAAMAPKALDIQVLTVRNGWNHTERTGTCGPEVTVEDIQTQFYNPFFGGRGAWVKDGRWGAITHND